MKIYVPSLREERDTIECLCHKCDGRGRYVGKKCDRCKGKGYTIEIKYLQGDCHKISKIEIEAFLAKLYK
jgi:DnaJ-class molecular chaperone